MAEEPQPAGVHEGVQTPAAPVAAEDRKAAAAMSNLDANQNDDEGAPKKDVDAEALGKAMKNLDVSDNTTPKNVVKKVVKVDPADVALLVNHLELTKPKATELLKAHDGDVTKALSAFVAVS
ncbi:hypothetical protein IWX90DRAFT_156813 [Phyllosticta citrichinensis]|uniref:Nascent polypeptide-associated complex subunit alpha-like UBA domain-containing protein n=1 Tax=Phyllosticta citrichinensis TaxID=1130410 RepID=A0ABR1Y047_9PEZI